MAFIGALSQMKKISTFTVLRVLVGVLLISMCSGEDALHVAARTFQAKGSGPISVVACADSMFRFIWLIRERGVVDDAVLSHNGTSVIYTIANNEGTFIKIRKIGDRGDGESFLARGLKSNIEITESDSVIFVANGKLNERLSNGNVAHIANSEAECIACDLQGRNIFVWERSQSRPNDIKDWRISRIDRDSVVHDPITAPPLKRTIDFTIGSVPSFLQTCDEKGGILGLYVKKSGETAHRIFRLPNAGGAVPPIIEDDRYILDKSYCPWVVERRFRKDFNKRIMDIIEGKMDIEATESPAPGAHNF